MQPSRVPSSEECTANAVIEPCGENSTWYAIWYPQLGGYVSVAAVLLSNTNPDGCFELVVYHDGEFYDEENPYKWHCCDAMQFVKFGNKVREIEDRIRGLGGGR